MTVTRVGTDSFSTDEPQPIDAGADQPAGVPADYPRRLEGSVVLTDGRSVAVRPVLPSDAARLMAFHDRLSAQTVYRRFFGAHPHLRPEEAEHFTCVDYRDRLALVAEIGGQLIAVARYEREPDTKRAEVAFVVADSYQHLGLGTILLKRLADAARSEGINTFDAETLVDNQVMRDVFHNVGFCCHEHGNQGVVDVSFAITANEPAAAAP